MLSIDATPNIKYNSAKMRQLLKPYLIVAMEAATDELLKRMKINIHKKTAVGRTGKGAPGDPKWRYELDMALKRLYEESTDAYLETGVGIAYTDTYEMVRAMLIAYGSGSEAVNPETGGNQGQPAIHAGPEGRMVWNDSLASQHPSTSSDHPMPDSFNQVGNDFAHKALEELEQHFDEVMKKALQNMPATLLQDCFTQ